MLKISFITSSSVKLEHARYLARSYNVEVISKRQYGRAYNEPRLAIREQLLEDSFRDALRRWHKTGANPSKDWFFIEDTSVSIDTLSTLTEYPGLDVKYWMQKMTFPELDRSLLMKDNNRAATIRSDVVLYLPTAFRDQAGLDREFLVFTSKLRGNITPYEMMSGTNPVYPWLDSKSFNKWFIPNGCFLPLSLLSIQDATQHDFRGSISKMLRYMHQHSVIHKVGFQQRVKQSPLMPSRGWIYIVSGLPCAGKTTLGGFLAENYGYYHVEASDFMRMAYYQRHGARSNISLHVFAEQALRDTPGIVVEQIIKEIYHVGDAPMIITGFRSAAEIDIFKQMYDGQHQVGTFFISAKQRLRYIRCRSRDRSDTLHNYSEFKSRDLLQKSMGLKTISASLKHYTILNNSTPIEYYQAFLERAELSSRLIPSSPLTYTTAIKLSLEQRILLSLLAHAQSKLAPLTTAKIAKAINALLPNIGIKTNKNNVSRYFNFKYHPYYKICGTGEFLEYELSQTGIGRATSISHALQKVHHASTTYQLSLAL